MKNSTNLTKNYRIKYNTSAEIDKNNEIRCLLQ